MSNPNKSLYSRKKIDRPTSENLGAPTGNPLSGGNIPTSTPASFIQSQQQQQPLQQAQSTQSLLSTTTRSIPNNPAITTIPSSAASARPTIPFRFDDANQHDDFLKDDDCLLMPALPTTIPSAQQQYSQQPRPQQQQYAGTNDAIQQSRQLTSAVPPTLGYLEPYDAIRAKNVQKSNKPTIIIHPRFGYVSHINKPSNLHQSHQGANTANNRQSTNSTTQRQQQHNNNMNGYQNNNGPRDIISLQHILKESDGPIILHQLPKDYLQRERFIAQNQAGVSQTAIEKQNRDLCISFDLEFSDISIGKFFESDYYYVQRNNPFYLKNELHQFIHHPKTARYFEAITLIDFITCNGTKNFDIFDPIRKGITPRISTFNTNTTGSQGAGNRTTHENNNNNTTRNITTHALSIIPNISTNTISNILDYYNTPREIVMQAHSMGKVSNIGASRAKNITSLFQCSFGDVLTYQQEKRHR